jgi:hypothetical protein
MSTPAQIALEAMRNTNAILPVPKAVRLATVTGVRNASSLVDGVTPVVRGVARGERHI